MVEPAGRSPTRIAALSAPRNCWRSVRPGWSVNVAGSHDDRRWRGRSVNWSYFLTANRTRVQDLEAIP